MWAQWQIIHSCDIPCLKMVHHIKFKMVVTSTGQKSVVIGEEIKGASTPLVIFYILRWMMGDYLSFVNLK